MRIIDRYVCREVLSHALLGLAVFTFVLLVPRLVRLMEVVVRHSGSAGDVARLVLCALPGVLAFTLPIAVLVGVLIGLGRMAADSELVAMSAVGLGPRRLALPVGALAVLAMALTFAMTLWLGPLSVRTLRALQNDLAAQQAFYEVRPRVFDERFPRAVLYVRDVPAAATRWQGVFLAESAAGDVTRLTLAEQAIVVADRGGGKLELHLRNGLVHEFSPRSPLQYGISAFAERDLVVPLAQLAPPAAAAATDAERSLAELAGRNTLAARIELHRRLAFPLACLVFPLIGLPLATRHGYSGSRAAGFVLALAVVCGYYLIFVLGEGLAREGSIPAWLGVWSANLAVAALGLAWLPGLSRSDGHDRLARVLALPRRWSHGLSRRAAPRPAATADPQPNEAGLAGLSPGAESPGRAPSGDARARIAAGRRRGGFPQTLHLHILRRFFFFFLVALASYLVLFQAITIFEILDSIVQNGVSAWRVLSYMYYLTYYLSYQLAPLACLVAALITLGIMAKNNELIAVRAIGLSLYRLAVPLLAAGLGLAVAMLLLDSTFLPLANQRQDALRNEILGRSAQTFYQPTRQWIAGEGSRLYNYQLFDADRSLFGKLNVFELDPASFTVRRRLYAERATWQPEENRWLLQSGWVRDFDGPRVASFRSFSEMPAPELSEPPTYFRREVRQSHQLNWWELRQYTAELAQAGFDVTPLAVQLHRKLAFPLIAPVMMLLAIPFSLSVGTRGAVGGLALGVGLSLVYWTTSALLEAMGSVGQLSPLVAAWAPDGIFFFVGLYFYLKMPT